MRHIRFFRGAAVLAAACFIASPSSRGYAQTTSPASAFSNAARQAAAVIGDLNGTYEELMKIYDTMAESLGRVEALGSNQPPPALQPGAMDKFVIEPRIAAIEQLVDNMPRVAVRALPALSSAGLGPLDNTERRARIRSGVADFSAGAVDLESGKLLISQYRETSRSIGTTISRLMELGERLLPMIVLVSAPVRDFTNDAGWRPINLLTTYPDRLKVADKKMDNRRRAGEETRKVTQVELARRVPVLSDALNAELAALKADHERFLKRTDDVGRLGEAASILQQQHALAIDALDRARGAQQRAEAALRDADERVRIANEQLWSAERQRLQGFEVTKQAYSWCPNRHPWDQCDHQDRKAAWMASAEPSAVEYRARLATVDERRADLSRRSQERQQASQNLQRAATEVSEVSRQRDQYASAWREKNVEYSKTVEQLTSDKYKSRIDLLWAANEADRTQLSRLAGRL